MKERHVCRLFGAAVLGVMLVPCAFAQDKPYFVTSGGGTRPVEGDTGTSVTHVEWAFSRPLESEVRFTVVSDETQMPSATLGVDYVGLAPTEVVVPAGQQYGSTPVEIIGDTEYDPGEMFSIRFHNFRGGATALGHPQVDYVMADIHIREDDVPANPLIVNDDNVTFLVNDYGTNIYVGENDLEYPDMLRGSTMTIVEQPQNGTVEISDPHDGIDTVYYRPDEDFGGRDRFRYRLCTPGGECGEANVYLTGELHPSNNAFSGGRVFGRSVTLGNLPALTDARYLASTLAVPQVALLETTVDATPGKAWDSRDGMDWVAATIPATADGQPAEYRIYVLSDKSYRDKVDLRIGVDTDGDGMPAAGEQRCFAGFNTLMRCEMVVMAGAQPVGYWVAAHSRADAAESMRVEIFQARMDANERGLVATGPAKAGARTPVDLNLSWYDPTSTVSDTRMGYVRVVDGDRVVGDFRTELQGGQTRLMLPLDGSTVPVDLADISRMFWSDREIFFDLPSGATLLTVTAKSDRPVDFHMVNNQYSEGESSEINVPYDPPESDWTRLDPGQTRTFNVNAPGYGRWYVMLRNPGERVRVELSVSVQGSAPTVRPGSYFNPRMPGSGVLLYPAGGQWAGLWYTYTRTGSPTWYYLQAPRPGANGVWSSPIYRDSWDGDSARHTRVGEMVVVATGPDRFIMNYTLDGWAGSQPMVPLGRGCPTSAGQPVDISSHWFDPAHAGTGYSVQMWQNYEFFAAFQYDRSGQPVFLLAESSSFKGDAADLPLEVLTGSCPTCEYRRSTRAPAGVLRRILSGGTLARIELDVDYAESWPPQGQETWSVVDQVQALGGPGTTQGCDP